MIFIPIFLKKIEEQEEQRMNTYKTIYTIEKHTSDENIFRSIVGNEHDAQEKFETTKEVFESYISNLEELVKQGGIYYYKEAIGESKTRFQYVVIKHPHQKIMTLKMDIDRLGDMILKNLKTLGAGSVGLAKNTKTICTEVIAPKVVNTYQLVKELTSYVVEKKPVEKAKNALMSGYGWIKRKFRVEEEAKKDFVDLNLEILENDKEYEINEEEYRRIVQTTAELCEGREMSQMKKLL